MTIRKFWLFILLIVAIFSVVVNSVILSSLTDNYFTDYLSESYNTHINQLIDYTEKALLNEDLSYKQMEMELEVHLTDPITEIKLYTVDGELLLSVTADYRINGDMMTGMMKRMMSRTSTNEVRQYKLKNGDELVGILNVTSYSLAEDSFVARRFKAALLSNSLWSLLIVSILVFILGMIISKKMSQSLMETAKIASSIQEGTHMQISNTRISEVNKIRDSLQDLDVRLRLKQKSRKTLVDGLIHQTRTPLTILKSHIEAIEDGIIEPSHTEFSICQNQIDNLTSIITNMGGMIDANKEVDSLNLEWVDVNLLIRQIKSGLLAQFKSKDVKIDFLLEGEMKIFTDKYKLSQSIFNILVNAYKYTDSGGEVYITAVIQNNNCVIKIEDTGIGIIPEDIDKIFTAYYRGSNSFNFTGDGIGLYIVKENINQIGGKISVESIVNNGSTFKIEVPIEAKS